MSCSHFHASFATLDRVRGPYSHMSRHELLPFLYSPKPGFSQDFFLTEIIAMKFSGLGFILLTDVPKCHSVVALLSRAEIVGGEDPVFLVTP